MRRIAALLLALTCMPVGAYADNQAKPEWYILSGFDGKCYKAKDRDPNMPSPAAVVSVGFGLIHRSCNGVLKPLVKASHVINVSRPETVRDVTGCGNSYIFHADASEEGDGTAFISVTDRIYINSAVQSDVNRNPWPLVLGGDVSAGLERAGGILGSLNGSLAIYRLISSCKPEFVSGPPKSECENSQHNGSNSNDSTVIFSSTDTSAGRSQLKGGDRFDEQGAFFVKGVIGLVFLAILYAVLKRF